MDMAKQLKYFISRLTPLSWMLIIVGIILVVAVLVTAGKNSQVEPVVDDNTGLIENVDELTPVDENDDITGEVLPPEDTATEPELDIPTEELTSQP